MLVRLRQLGGQDLMKRGTEITTAVAQRAEDRGTHDIGFLFEPSACLLFDETGDELWLRQGLAAADTLAARARPGGYIQAFGTVDDPASSATSTIDTMMNLPLLWWAGARTQDDRYTEIAARHARATAQHFIRDDGSTYHLVRYSESGSPTWRGTYQGAMDTSCWTRGQAWAIHGFILSTLETGEPAFLEAAKATLDFYFDRHDPSELPPNDLTIDTGVRDSSAAAIVASALAVGRARLDERTWSALSGEARLAQLLRTLRDRAVFADEIGILAHACYSLPHGLGVDGPAPYGDYFYLQALHALSSQEAIAGVE